MIPKDASDLLKVDAKDRGLYAQFSLVHLTAYSVHWLSEWEIPTTYENVSVLNGRLFPDEFSMRGFSELPDAFRTNRSLLQMRPKYRNFATSDPRRGVYLTEKGNEAAGIVLRRIGPPSIDNKPLPTLSLAIDPRRPNRDMERNRNPAQTVLNIRTKILFRRFKENRLDQAEIVHLLGLVGLYDHTLPIEVRKAFSQLRADAVEVNDTEILNFLDSVAKQFHGYLHRTDPRRAAAEMKR